MFKTFLRNTFAAVIATCAMTLSLSAANAATFATFYDDAASETGARFNLITTTDNAFEVLVAQPSIYDSTAPLIGQMFTVHPNDPSELAFVNNNLVAGDGPFTSGTKDDGVGNNFITSARYILLKIGGGNSLATALIHNISGGTLDIDFGQLGNGSGLSHITEYGSVTPIPLPAGFLLLIGGLGTLMVAGHRKPKSS
ncbi:hypothetical protein ABLO27_11330 [Roseibium sp. SCPC15]|uniref:hypothetical protein n=1 Tax=Roseibium sp. SCP15 TaxID=3141376 RepID=UPI003338E3FF